MPTLSEPMDCSLPGSFVHGIFQARVLEWVAIAFSNPPTRVMEIKTNVNKWDLIKLKSFYTAKETISKVKRQPSEWEKIIANETIDKRLISKICKQLIQLNTRKTNMSIKKWEIDLNRHFSKDIQRANKHMKNAQHRSLLEKCTSKYSEIPLHISQNCHQQKFYKQ